VKTLKTTQYDHQPKKRILTYILLALLAAIPPFVVYRLLDGRAAMNDSVASFAGKNYKELKRVLNHYSGDKADSLKLKATRFLVDNMSYHIGVPQRLTDRQGNEVEFDFSTFPVGDFKRLCAVMDSLGYRFERGTPLYDIQVITAEYLIENIDDAFTAWEYPWAKHLGLMISARMYFLTAARTNLSLITGNILWKCLAGCPTPWQQTIQL
jgi:hypothetical protein